MTQFSILQLVSLLLFLLVAVDSLYILSRSRVTFMKASPRDEDKENAGSGRRLFKSLFNKSQSKETATISQGDATADLVESAKAKNDADQKKKKTKSKSVEEEGIFLDVDTFGKNIEDLTLPTSPDFKSGFVSIVGNPNVGKSTLLNALLGQKLNIVSPKPQTTRHRIKGILTEQNYQIVFTDTPGMLKPVYKMQETMRDVVHEAVRDSDVTVLVTDIYGENLHDDRVMLRLNGSSSPIIVAINKVDILSQSSSVASKSNRERAMATAAKNITELYAFWSELLPKAEILEISAAQLTGLSGLKEKLVTYMQPGPKYYPDDDMSDRDERFFTTEIIRETLFEMFQEEVPYSCEVVINSFKDKSSNLSLIDASIIVDRESQKGIIIGKGGSKLKELGTNSRLKLENFLDRKVFLTLTIKLDEDWRSKESSLQKYGYIDE